MEENRFEQILDFLCSGIMSKKERENVKDELYDHLMTKYEINLATGMNEEQAAENAVDALGNRIVLRDNLSKVHSYFPALSVKKAMTLILVGYLFMSIHINLFEGMQQITTAIGTVIFLTGLFCFRKANKELNAAFFTRFGAELISTVCLAVDPLAGGIPALNICFSTAQILLNVFSWIFLFKGLKKLTEPYAHVSPKPLRYGLCTFFACVPSVISGALALAVTGGEKTTYNFTSDELGWLIFPIFAVAITGIVVTVQLFWRINKLLYGSDHEYKVEDSSAKKFWFAFAAVALSCIMILAGDFAYSYQKADIMPHSIEDFKMSDEEYLAICEDLQSYGIPQELIEKLPKSEIANYRGIVNANELTESQKITVDDPFEVYGRESISGKNLKYAVESYIVRIEDETGMYARFIKRFTYVEPENSADINYYVDGISIPSQDYNNFLTAYIPDYEYETENWKYNNDTVLFLSEENGTLYKNEPLKIFNRSDLSVFPHRGIAGFEYEAKEGLQIIFATSYNVFQYDSLSMMKHVKLIHRTSPIAFQNRTAKSLMDFGETLHNNSAFGYDRFIIATWFRIFDYEEQKKKEESYDETSDVYADKEPQNLEPTEIYYEIDDMKNY